MKSWERPHATGCTKMIICKTCHQPCVTRGSLNCRDCNNQKTLFNRALREAKAQRKETK